MATSHPQQGDPATGLEDRGALSFLRLVAPPTRQDPGARPATLSVRHRVSDGARVLELSGESDIVSLPALQAALLEAVPTAGSQEMLVVDVSALTFCDVRSATLVVEAGRTVRTALAGAHGVVNRVFDLVDTSETLVRCDGPPWPSQSA